MLKSLIVLIAAAASLTNIATAVILYRRERRWFLFPWLMALGLTGMAVSQFSPLRTALWGVLASSVLFVVGAALLMRFALTRARRVPWRQR